MASTGDRHLPEAGVDRNLLLLLRVLRGNGSVETLIGYGLTFSQIGRLLVEAKEKRLIEERGGGLALSEAGIALIGRSADHVVRRDGGWIHPEDISRIDPIPVDDVYLPTPRDTKFKAWRAH